MKESILNSFKSILKYLLTLAGVALVVALIIFVSTRPKITGSILEAVELDNGQFTLDGLRKGMSEAEVAATLDARNLVYAYSKDAPQMSERSSTWISLSDETRIEELGRVTVRRTYYFQNDGLTHVDLETVVIKNQVQDDLERFEDLREILDNAFGKGELVFGSTLTVPGEVNYLWQGAEESCVTLIGRYYQMENWVKTSKDAPTTFTDNMEILIRVKL